MTNMTNVLSLSCFCPVNSKSIFRILKYCLWVQKLYELRLWDSYWTFGRKSVMYCLGIHNFGICTQDRYPVCPVCVMSTLRSKSETRKIDSHPGCIPYLMVLYQNLQKLKDSFKSELPGQRFPISKIDRTQTWQSMTNRKSVMCACTKTRGFRGNTSHFSFRVSSRSPIVAVRIVSPPADSVLDSKDLNQS